MFFSVDLDQATIQLYLGAQFISKLKCPYLQQRQPYGDSDDQTVRTVQIHHDIQGGLTPFTGCYETQFRLSLILVVCVATVCKIATPIISKASRGTYEAVHQQTYTRNAGSF